MIIIADSHVGKEGDPEAFMEMLRRLEQTKEPVVFLGDIFDLWIGMARYEEAIHRQFREWCMKMKEGTTIGFIEGNHEFFLEASGNSPFSWCSDTEYRMGDTLFAHGDLVNVHDTGYRRFRGIVRSQWVRRIFRVLPFGPQLAHAIKARAKKTNQEFRNVFPEEHIREFGTRAASAGARHAFLGHFHQPYRCIACDSCKVHTLPGWYIHGEVCRFTPDSGEVTVGKWQDILAEK